MPHQLDALKLAASAVAAGARGVVIGRNVIQAANPPIFLAGLKNVVKEDAAPEVVAAELGLE